MSQSDCKRIRKVPFHRRSVLCTGITIIWLEDSDLLSKETDEIVDRLRALNKCHVFRYTTIAKCIKYLKRARSYERIIVVMNHYNCAIIAEDISRLCHYRQMQSIFILSLITSNGKDAVIDLSDNTRDEIGKIGGIFHDYPSLFVRLQQLIKEVEESDDDLFTFFNRPEKALRDLRKELSSFIWSQSLKVVLKAMSYNSFEAKQEMLIECRACCWNDPYELNMINEFERIYHSADAILWYTKPCFLYQLVNKALRTEDNLLLYKFRYFIIDLCVRLEEAALTSVDHKQPFRVYRGANLGRNELEKLEVGSLVATNGFFSSSKHLDVAQRFIGIDPDTGMSPSQSRNDQRQYVLFEIDVDLINSPNIVVTDVSGRSAIPDENEMLFNLGTTFIIRGTHYDNEHRVWYINLISSSEVATVSQEYNTHIEKRFSETKPIIMFGHLLSEMSSDYHGALTYFHRLLRSTSWDDEDRPDIYHYLGRAYRALGKSHQALIYFRCALLLQRRRLPDSSMVYGRALSCLGTIYSESGDLLRSIRLYEQAMAIYRRVLPKNHYEFGFHSNRLAQVYWQNGQYDSAHDLLMNTIPFVKKTMPSNYPGQAQTFHLMGLVKHSLNDREQAVHYFEQALQMRESFHGNDHPYTARTCYELGILYEELGDYSTALTYARRSLNICETKLSSNHKDVKQSTELVQRLLQRHNAT